MLYAIRCSDVPDSLEKRKAVRPAHIARLEELRDAGRLILSGPLPAIDAEDPGPAGFTGSLIVAEFESLEAARKVLITMLNRLPALTLEVQINRWRTFMMRTGKSLRK